MPAALVCPNTVNIWLSSWDTLLTRLKNHTLVALLMLTVPLEVSLNAMAMVPWTLQPVDDVEQGFRLNSLLIAAFCVMAAGLAVSKGSAPGSV